MKETKTETHEALFKALCDKFDNIDTKLDNIRFIAATARRSIKKPKKDKPRWIKAITKALQKSVKKILGSGRK